MPRATVHKHFNVIIVVPLFTFLLYQVLIWCEIDYQLVLRNTLFFVLAFLYGTFFFSPDLDVAYMNRLWSWRIIFNFPFIPYALLFRHRGISHHPFWGLISRVLYLLLLIILGVYLYFLMRTFWNVGLVKEDLGGEAQKTVFFIGSWGKEFQAFLWKNRLSCLLVILGFFISDFSHLALDRLSRFWPFKR